MRTQETDKRKRKNEETKMVTMKFENGKFEIQGTGHAEREAANKIAMIMTDADIAVEVHYSGWSDGDTITIVQVGVWENGEIVYI